MSLQIKIILAVALLALGGLAAWYVQGLRAENEALTADNVRLVAVNMANALTIKTLKDEAAKADKVLDQWAEVKNELVKSQERLAIQIKKDLQNNESFKNWADNSLPANVSGLFNPANGN